MITRHPLIGLLIRTAVVRKYDVGYILACDPKKEKQEIPHTIIFSWKGGKFTRGEAKFGAHTCCIVQEPEPGLLCVAGSGTYSVDTRNGVTVRNIFDVSQPQRKDRRYGDLRSVAEIGGKGYAVGLEGMAYRLDELEQWARIDEGLPRGFDIEAIHGFSASDIYAVGYRGELWHSNGQKWAKYDLPTSVILGCVKCAGDGMVYIGGNNGILIRGRSFTWDIVDHGETTETVWDLEWFEGELYVSTMSSVYRLKGERLELIDFGNDPPRTCYQLSVAKGVLWSIGEKDIISYTDKKWTRII